MRMDNPSRPSEWPFFMACIILRSSSLVTGDRNIEEVNDEGRYFV